MKTLLIATAIAITSISSSLAGPSWGFTLGNGAGFSWNNERPQCMPRPIYRVHGVRQDCHRRVRNHMNAPLVIDYRNRGGRTESVVIPASWD